MSSDKSTWDCRTVVQKEKWPGVVWTQLNCTGETPHGNVGPMVFNTLRANIASPSITAVPAQADPKVQLQVRSLGSTAFVLAGMSRVTTDGICVADFAAFSQNVADMAASIPVHNGETIVAGINGGYFWRVDSKSVASLSLSPFSFLTRTHSHKHT